MIFENGHKSGEQPIYLGLLTLLFSYGNISENHSFCKPKLSFPFSTLSLGLRFCLVLLLLFALFNNDLYCGGWYFWPGCKQTNSYQPVFDFSFLNCKF